MSKTDATAAYFPRVVGVTASRATTAGATVACLSPAGLLPTGLKAAVLTVAGGVADYLSAEGVRTAWEKEVVLTELGAIVLVVTACGTYFSSTTTCLTEVG